MSTALRLERLSETNFADFESLTSCGPHSGCYCSFWHQKWARMEDFEKQQKEAPHLNRAIVFEKMRAGFHVGVLAYEGDQLLAWISVGPLPDFHWTWKRLAQTGEAAKSVAGILCITLDPQFRGKGRQAMLLQALATYGKNQGWSSLEGYPFDPGALEKHGESLLWPGHPKGFEAAGFSHRGAHWLSSPEAARSIYSITLI